MRYRILDPTGNITALVEDEVPVDAQPSVASAIMREHPEVEQVGFVRYTGTPELRMAGGEFCGNASMCAAALYAETVMPDAQSVSLKVSGSAEPVTVRLSRTDEGAFDCAVRMPVAVGVEKVAFGFDGLSDELPIVRVPGISHAIIESSSSFYALLTRPKDAERAVRVWCEELGVDGLGLMFLEGEGQRRRCTPLVYVPGSGTVFWENSCASGSAAVGMFLNESTLTLHEPGGVLRVECAPDGRIWLHGHVKM